MKKNDVAKSVIKTDPKCNRSLLSTLLGIGRKTLSYVSQLDIHDESVRKEFETIHSEHPWYGKRRMAWSIGCGFHRASRLMKKFAIFARTKKARVWIKKDDVKIPDTKIPNIAKEIPADRPNRVWRTDFTYLSWRGMRFYLATILDAYSRDIVGYSMSFLHTKEFALEALKDAISKSTQLPEALHSDQGSEYRSFLFLNFLADVNIQPSMSTKGSPWQNGQQESYYGKFKLEMGNLNAYNSFEEVIEAIHHQIYYYNNKRIHTALKMPPMHYRERYLLLEKENLV